MIALITTALASEPELPEYELDRQVFALGGVGVAHIDWTRTESAPRFSTFGATVATDVAWVEHGRVVVGSLDFVTPEPGQPFASLDLRVGVGLPIAGAFLVTQLGAGYMAPGRGRSRSVSRRGSSSRRTIPPRCLRSCASTWEQPATSSHSNRRLVPSSRVEPARNGRERGRTVR